MINNAIQRLEYLCDFIPRLLLEIDDATFAEKPAAGKWSKKEIIGHLIDSATNNHQRFVRTQFEDKPVIKYDQNKWNEFSYYQQMDGAQVISFWTVYNKQLAALIRHIPREYLQRECMAGGELFTLEFLINDYVSHMEHHLHQVVSY